MTEIGTVVAPPLCADNVSVVDGPDVIVPPFDADPT